MSNLVKTIKSNWLLCLFIALFAVFSAMAWRDALSNISAEFFFGDFHGRWQECAYTLRGVNPMNVIHGLVPADPNIGGLPDIAGTVPWAYLLGNVYMFGFLPYDIAKILGILSFPIVIAITGYFAYKYMNGKTANTLFGILAILIILCNPHWVSSFRMGNGGGIASCLILLMVLFLDRKPYLAGVLLALATVKPQLAAVFYISLLLQKRWKTVITASSIVLGSWLLVSVMTNSSPIQMLMDMWRQGTEAYGKALCGIFTILVDFEYLTRQQALFMSAVLGVAVLLLLSFFAMRNDKLKGNDMLFYSIPAVVSTFWFYKQGHEYLIIIILAMSFLAVLPALKLNKFAPVLLICVSILYFFDESYFTLFFQKGFGLLDNFIPVFYYFKISVDYLLLYFTWMCWLLFTYALYSNGKIARAVKKIFVKDGDLCAIN